MTLKLRYPEILNNAQATEALIVIDGIGHLANRAPVEIAGQLDALRARLRMLINEIDNPDGDSGAGAYDRDADILGIYNRSRRSTWTATPPARHSRNTR